MAASKPVWGLGRRKSAVARVRLLAGSGKILVNGKDFEVYFPTVGQQRDVLGPLKATDSRAGYDVLVNVKGGGPRGQAGAVKLGIARCLLKQESDAEAALREGGFLTRDPRMKERKKYGQRGARRRFQFSKR